MKALVIHGKHDLKLEDQPSEEVGPNQVKIKSAIGGICGSDLHYFNHGGFGTVKLREPMILGHEVSGYVEEIGANVTSIQVGDLVAVSPSRPCGHCQYCLEGLPNHCENMRFYGSAMPFPHIQGAFREVLIADASQCVIANGLTPQEAAMAEPLAVTIHAARRAGDLIGARVLVTGAGPIGLLCIKAARMAGATDITVTDLTDFTLAKAQEIGASETINTGREPEKLARFSAGKGHFDVLFECTGVAAALANALTTMRPRGIVVQLGLGGEMTLPMSLVTTKELDLRGSFRFHSEFETAVKAMQLGLVDVKPLLTHEFALRDFDRAFQTASHRSSALKVQLDLGSLG